MEGGTVAATAFLVSAFRLLVLAARLRADFSFRFRTAFFRRRHTSFAHGHSFRIVFTACTRASATKLQKTTLFPFPKVIDSSNHERH